MGIELTFNAVRKRCDRLIKKGLLERYAPYTYVEKGDWINTGIFGALFLLTFIAKHRVGDGPITKLLKAPTHELKAKVVDISRTWYKG